MNYLQSLWLKLMARIHTVEQKSVDSVLSSFNKALAELRAVATQHEAHVLQHDDMIQSAMVSRESHAAEAARAGAIASRFDALLSA